MPQGLQVWDATGRIVLDTSNRVTKIVGRVYLSGVAGSLIVPGLLGNNVFFNFNPDPYSARIDNAFPAITLSGQTVAWSYPRNYYTQDGPAITGWLTYGLY